MMPAYDKLRLSSRSPPPNRTPVQLGPQTTLPTAIDVPPKTITPPFPLENIDIPRSAEKDRAIPTDEIPHTYWGAGQIVSPPLVQYHMSYHLLLKRSTLRPSSASSARKLSGECSSSLPEVKANAIRDSSDGSDLTLRTLESDDYFNLGSTNLTPPTLDELQDEFPKLFDRGSSLHLLEMWRGLLLDAFSLNNDREETIDLVLTLESAVSEYLKHFHENFRLSLDRPIPEPILVPFNAQIVGNFTESMQLHLINICKQIKIEYQLLGSLILLFNIYVLKEFDVIKRRIASIDDNRVNYSRVMFESLKQFKRMVVTYNPLDTLQEGVPSRSPFTSDVQNRSDEESTRVILVDLLDNIATTVADLVREFNDIIEDEYLFLEGDLEDEIEEAELFEVAFGKRQNELQDLINNVESLLGQDGDGEDEGYEAPSMVQFGQIVAESRALFKDYIDTTCRLIAMGSDNGSLRQ